jgi:hypothetical protein
MISQVSLNNIKKDLTVVTIVFVIAHVIKTKVILKSDNLFTPSFIEDLAGTLVGFSVFNSIESLLPKLPSWLPIDALKVSTMVVVKTIVLAFYKGQDIKAKFSNKFLMNLAMVFGSLVLYDVFVKNILNKSGKYDKIKKLAPVIDEVSGKGWSMVISDIMGDGDIETETPTNVLVTLMGILGFHLINGFINLV